MDAVICPKGHQSIDHDYCSECGAKIGNGTGSGFEKGIGNGLGAAPASTDFDVCPDCGTKREHKGVAFCEICGFNFLTGARGEVPMEYSVAAPSEPEPMRETVPEPVPELVDEPAEAVPADLTTAWTATVTIEQTFPQPDSPDPPTDFVPFAVTLDKPVTLIGRTSQTRAIFPEIALDHDDAVSHRHALLQFDAAGGLVVRDIGAANGTMVNGKEIKAMVDHPLTDGDEISLGHWSRIKVKMTTAGTAA